MKSVYELAANSKVASTASDCPEEVTVFCFRGRYDGTIPNNHCRLSVQQMRVDQLMQVLVINLAAYYLNEIVNDKSMGSTQPSVSPTQSKSM